MKNQETTTQTDMITNDFFSKFEALNDADLKEIEIPCITFEEGEVKNLIACEIQEKEFQDGKKDVVILQDATGAQFYNGNAYIVNGIKQIKNSLPFPVRITCTGTKKGANGTYKTFSIKTLG